MKVFPWFVPQQLIHALFTLISQPVGLGWRQSRTAPPAKLNALKDIIHLYQTRPRIARDDLYCQYHDYVWRFSMKRFRMLLLAVCIALVNNHGRLDNL
jgi:hypothetical protein